MKASRIALVVAALGALTAACQQTDRDRERNRDRYTTTAPVVQPSDRKAVPTPTVNGTTVEMRILGMQAKLGVAAGEKTVISSLATTLPAQSSGRNDVDLAVQALASQIELTRNLVDSLHAAPAAEMDQRRDQIADAMARLDQTREEAWKKLSDAIRDEIKPAA